MFPRTPHPGIPLPQVIDHRLAADHQAAWAYGVMLFPDLTRSLGNLVLEIGFFAALERVVSDWTYRDFLRSEEQALVVTLLHAIAERLATVN